MTTPTQDRDITATLSAPRKPTTEALEAAAARLLDSVEFLEDAYYGDEWRVVDMRDTEATGWWWCALTGATARMSATHDHPTAQAAAVDLLRHHPELWPAEPDENVEWEHAPEGGWYRSQNGRPPAWERVDVRTSDGRIFRNVCTVNHAWNWKAVQWRSATHRDGAPDETAPEPQPLTVAAREALRLVVRAGHEASPSEHDDSESCCICSEPWPCEVEQARRILADAIDTDTDAGAAALAALDSPEATR